MRRLVALAGVVLAPAANAQAPTIVSLLPAAKTVLSGAQFQLTVHISPAAPVGGVVIELTVSDPAVLITPASVTVPEGMTSASFSVVSASTGSASVTATLGGSFASAAISVVVAARRFDFDGDGRADVLWRNSSSGENYLFPMSGIAIGAGEGYLRTVADTNWKVAGLGDFDGDGKADIVWRNSSTGENYVYLMSGTVIAGEGYLRTVASQDWRVAGVGDFDGDGRDDILWRNHSSGENYVFLMNGLGIAGEGYVRTVADLDWQVAGVGDFDGDGRADVLWRHAVNGQNYVYLMQGLGFAGEGYLRTVADLGWQVKGVGDFDGDGKADIVWRHSSTGENYLYLLDGTGIAGEGYLRTVAASAWQIVALGDYDGDGSTDILWRNSATGENYLFFMGGLSILNEGYLRTVAALGWTVQPAAAAAPPAPAENNLAFVTSTTYNGNLGGVQGADQLCQARAVAAGLSGSFVAWLSNDASSAGSRLGAARGWNRVDGRPFADTVAELISGQIFYPLALNEFGAVVPPSAVFTGTRSTGAPWVGVTCSDWTSTVGSGLTGWATSAGHLWTDQSFPSLCGTPARLYCLATGSTAPLAFTPANGRLAFLTAGTFRPGGGLAAADALCQSEAGAAGQAGTYRALLATDTASAASRFNPVGMTWVRPDGVEVFDNAADLFSTTLSAALNVTLAGEYVTLSPTWLGAAGFGSVGTQASTCVNWTSTTGGSGGTAFPDRTADLTPAPPLPCSSARRLFCLQQ